MLNCIILFVISFLFALADELKIWAFSCDPKRFDW
jgi:hypothetical protein